MSTSQKESTCTRIPETGYPLAASLSTLMDMISHLMHMISTWGAFLSGKNHVHQNQ